LPNKVTIKFWDLIKTIKNGKTYLFLDKLKIIGKTPNSIQRPAEKDL